MGEIANGVSGFNCFQASLAFVLKNYASPVVLFYNVLARIRM